MASLRDVLMILSNEAVNDLRVRDAKKVFDVFFDTICKECIKNEIKVPTWNEAFGLWLTVQP